MTGEIEFFRKRFVGGFNRDDVAKYISKLSQERNDWKGEKEKADQDILVLNDQIAALNQELAKARQEVREALEYKAAGVEAAVKSFEKLGIDFGNLCTDLETTAESICTEFDQARRTVSALPEILRQAGNGIRELQEACQAEKPAAPAETGGAVGGADEHQA